MSVPMLDKTLNPSSTPTPSRTAATSEAKVARPMPSALSFNSHSAADVNFRFRETQGGPVFGNYQPSTERHYRPCHPGYQGGAPAMPSFMEQFKQWMTQWFGGGRPPHRPGCGNPPPRPDPTIGNPPPRPFPTMPGRPDPHYSKMNREELAQLLLNNFDAFKDPSKPGYISTESLHAMANKSCSSDPLMNQNIRLAQELLRRPELTDALDRHSSTGALDGLIDRQNLSLVIKGENYFKYKSDKELAGEMLEHFDDLKGRRGAELKISDLRKLASQPPTQDSDKNHLIQLAQEILKRGDVLKRMDNLAGNDNDGRISRKALKLLSR